MPFYDPCSPYFDVYYRKVCATKMWPTAARGPVNNLARTESLIVRIMKLLKSSDVLGVLQ